MQGILIKDWSKFDFQNPKHQEQLMTSLKLRIAMSETFPVSEFTDPKHPNFHGEKLQKHLLETREIVRAGVQEFTTTGDFPTKALEVIEKFHLLANYDTGYESIFDVRDYTNSGQMGFRMMDVQSGMTFTEIPIGGKIKLKQMSGTQEFVFFDYYGGGLNWHRTLFENQDWWTLEDNAMAFINAAYFRRASVHYQLLEAAMNSKTCITLQDPGCDNCDAYAIALAKAINYAITTILTNVQNKGYGETVGSTFILLAPIQALELVNSALSVRLQAFEASERIQSFNVQKVFTMMLTNTNRIGVILPKVKIKSGNRLNLETFSSFDMLTRSDAVAGWMGFGAAIGDLDQIECIDTTPVSGIEGGPRS